MMGYALSEAQKGRTPSHVKPLSGFGGASVLEIARDHAGDAYRTVYTVRFPGVVCVLHVFQKKATRGISTPKHEMELVHARFKEAERIYGGPGRWRVRETILVPYGPEASMDREHDSIEHTPGGGNVFADLNLPGADVLLAQSDLMGDITHAIRSQKLSRERAARIMGITEQEVRDIEYGDFDHFSVERLAGLLDALVRAGEARAPRAGGGRGAVRKARH